MDTWFDKLDVKCLELHEKKHYRYLLYCFSACLIIIVVTVIISILLSFLVTY